MLSPAKLGYPDSQNASFHIANLYLHGKQTTYPGMVITLCAQLDGLRGIYGQHLTRYQSPLQNC